MGVIKKTPWPYKNEDRRGNDVEATDAFCDSADADQEEISEEMEVEEDDQADRTESPASASQRRIHLPSKPGARPPIKSPQPAASAMANSGDGRRYLNMKINSDLHVRLKFYSYRTGRRLMDIIESWIEANCPPV